MSISKEDFAARLNGREYGDEISEAECREAKGAGLLVIFGYSDDNVEFRGLFSDEVGAYAENGTSIKLTKEGILGTWEDVNESEEEAAKYFEQKRHAKSITAFYDRPVDDHPWTFTTDIPHATFEIMEEGKKFCLGIIISQEDL